MFRRPDTKHTYDEISDYHSASGVELAFLPPLVTAQSKKTLRDDIITLLDHTDGSYSPFHQDPPQ